MIIWIVSCSVTGTLGHLGDCLKIEDMKPESFRFYAGQVLLLPIDLPGNAQVDALGDEVEKSVLPDS